MKRLLLTLTALFGLIFISFSQKEKLSGKVLNSKNEPVVGASIKFEGSHTGAISGVDGGFTLTLAIGKKYTLIISSVGYEMKTIQDVEVAAGQANELQVLMVESAKNTLGGVTVTATASSARKETSAALIQFQKNTNTVASVISAEQIRRSPDKTTGEVLKRVPGTSIMEGRFIVVRGLADRYNQAMINGILLTSTEPDRKTFSFDLIPAPMIDNIIINTVVPLLFAYGSYQHEQLFKDRCLQWLEQVSAESNTITRGFQQIGIGNKSAFDSQALLELKTQYCDKRRCLDCAVGNALLNIK